MAGGDTLKTDGERINELREQGEGLTAWEIKFLGDLERKLDQGLTEKQQNKLMQIYRERLK